MTASREPSNQSFEFDREATVCFASRRFFLMVSCAIDLRKRHFSHAGSTQVADCFARLSAASSARRPAAFSVGDIHLAKPKSFHKRATYGSFAIQNHIDHSAINAATVRKSGLTSLAFNCTFQQMNNVIIIKNAIMPFPRRLHSDAGRTLLMTHVFTERVSRWPD
jgi:hypothetical protein